MSRLLIASVGGGLNETEVNCVDVSTSNSSYTVITVKNEDPLHGQSKF